MASKGNPYHKSELPKRRARKPLDWYRHVQEMNKACDAFFQRRGMSTQKHFNS